MGVSGSKSACGIPGLCMEHYSIDFEGRTRVAQEMNSKKRLRYHANLYIEHHGSDLDSDSDNDALGRETVSCCEHTG